MSEVIAYGLPHQLEILNQFGFWAYREAISRVETFLTHTGWVEAIHSCWGCVPPAV